MMDDRPIFRDVLVPRLMVVMDTKDCNHGNVETEICLSEPEETGPVILPLRYRKHVRNSKGHKYHPPDTRKNSGVSLLNDVTDSGGCCRDSPLNDVTVSGNFCRKCRHRYGVPPGNGCNGVYYDNDVIDESSEGSRKKDLTVALAWLRQEIGKLKEQDKVLTRQFLELRAVIRSLQESGSGTSSFGSGSDVTNVSGSAQSLNEDGRHDGSRRGSRNNSLLRGEDYLGEFRGRTVSLLLPKSAMSLSVDKYKSRECF